MNPRSTHLLTAATLLVFSTPAYAVDIAPTGQLFTDYSLPATGGGVAKFEFTRAWLGATVKVNDQLSGKLVYSANAPTATTTANANLQYGYVAFGPSWGTFALGQQETLFDVPVEQTWFPRFLGKSFSEAEGVLSPGDQGFTAKLGGDSWGGLRLQLGYFNGEGLNPETNGTKAYEGLVSWKTGGLGAVLFGRSSADDNSQQAALGLNYNGGSWFAAAEGITAAMPTTKTASASTGTGGSLTFALPNLASTGITPRARGDYYTSNKATGASDAHVRGIVALQHDYPSGVSVSLDDTYTHYLDASAGLADVDVVAVHSQLKF